MKKKFIAMLCFILLTTATSVYVMLDASKQRANNTVDNSNVATNNNVTTNANIQNVQETKQSPTSTNKTTDTNPSDGAKNTSTTQPQEKTDESYTLYEVKKDDTLLTICKNYENICPTSVLSKAILKANKLSTSKDIKPAMTLKIPDKYINGSSYTVKSGDTISTIAQRYLSTMALNTAIEKIKTDNFITNNTIKIGEQIYIANSSSIKDN
jgi:LysM repeat protein